MCDSSRESNVVAKGRALSRSPVGHHLKLRLARKLVAGATVLPNHIQLGCDARCEAVEVPA